MKTYTKVSTRTHRHRRIRARLQGTLTRPRLSVFRSGKHVYAQLIDDVKGKTICSVSDVKGIVKEVKEGASRKVGLAFLVGKSLAVKAKEKGVATCIFDRGGYAYHGRIRAVAEGAREGGLQF